MAAPYNDTGTLTNLLANAIDRKMRFALRSLPQFRSIADTKPVDVTNPGTTVVFNQYADLAVATTPLNEITDPTGTNVANPTQTQVTINEYGNYTVTTKKLQAFALDRNLDGSVAQLLANNMVDSVDALVKAQLDTGTNTLRINAGVLKDSNVSAGAVNLIAAGDKMTSAAIRYSVAKFRGQNIAGVRGDVFGAYVHPDVAHDIRAEAGSNTAWREPHIYGDQGAIWAAETGQYEGCFFVETPRATIQTGAGASGANVYHTYLFGREALAEAVTEEFHTVIGGVVVDPLLRKTPIGWYGMAGWAKFRAPALRLVQTSSSIG